MQLNEFTCVDPITIAEIVSEIFLAIVVKCPHLCFG
jgi:hypothetical protein